MVEGRLERKGVENPTGSVRQLFEYESQRWRHFYDGMFQDAIDSLRLVPHGEHRPVGNKLDTIRTPVLIVHAANDPVAPAQEIADLIAQTDNPNVAALVLHRGGHVAFHISSRRYFYSLMVNFFSPTRGPDAVAPR
jgi:pimeloyl-ACP methyl ester carboxylesterase